jgi:ribosome maturation factor RimP
VDLDAITDVTPLAIPRRRPTLPGCSCSVSSPGVDARCAHLRTTARATTVSTGSHRHRYRARARLLVESDDEGCTIETDGERAQIRYRDITQARTVFEWGPQPRPGQRSAGKAATASKRARASRGASA